MEIGEVGVFGGRTEVDLDATDVDELMGLSVSKKNSFLELH